LNINLGIIYGLGRNLTEKTLRLLLAILTLVFLYVLSWFSAYSFSVLVVVNVVLPALMILLSNKIINLEYKPPLRSLKDEIFEIISKDERDIIKTTIPAMLIINTLPFIVAITLTPQDSVNFSIAQQLYNGLGLIVLAPIVMSYKKLTEFCITNMMLARALLLDVLSKTAFIIIITQIGLYFFLNDFLLAINKNLDFFDYTFITIYIALMSFEWLQSVMTRAAMATGYFDYSKQTAAAGVLTVALATILGHNFGLYGLLCAVIIAQIPTCHFFNIKIALEKFEIRFKDFNIAILPYYFALVVIMMVNIK
jgi:hypothetical protein